MQLSDCIVEVGFMLKRLLELIGQVMSMPDL